MTNDIKVGTARELSDAYRCIFAGKANTPAWAVHKKSPPDELVHCPIPFVGKDYPTAPIKILLYASAENLCGYNGYLDCDDIALDRHRRWFNESAARQDSFFPNVHIEPISDGCLATVAFYIYSKLAVAENISPSEFLERICFANYCKYTIQSASNVDYASDPKKLAESREYIASDTAILCPDIIIMPRSIYKYEKEFISGISGGAMIIPIFQINCRTINCQISKKYPKADASLLDGTVLDWYRHLGANGITGKTKENFLSVFSYLDDVLAGYRQIHT